MATRHEQQFTARLRTIVDRAGGATVVAKIVGVTKEAIYGWLAGSRPYPRTVSKLCSKLGVSEQWLTDGTDTADASSEISTRMNEEQPPAAKDDEQLCRDLSEMLTSFDSLPASFEPFALATIDNHYIEFRRRAHIRADARAKIQRNGKPK